MFQKRPFIAVPPDEQTDEEFAAQKIDTSNV